MPPEVLARVEGAGALSDAQTTELVDAFALNRAKGDFVAQLGAKGVVSATARDGAQPYSLYANWEAMDVDQRAKFAVAVSEGLRRRKKVPTGTLAEKVAALRVLMDREVRSLTPRPQGSLPGSDRLACTASLSNE